MKTKNYTTQNTIGIEDIIISADGNELPKQKVNRISGLIPIHHILHFKVLIER